MVRASGGADADAEGLGAVDAGGAGAVDAGGAAGAGAGAVDAAGAGAADAAGAGWLSVLILADQANGPGLRLQPYEPLAELPLITPEYVQVLAVVESARLMVTFDPLRVTVRVAATLCKPGRVHVALHVLLVPWRFQLPVQPDSDSSQ